MSRWSVIKHLRSKHDEWCEFSREKDSWELHLVVKGQSVEEAAKKDALGRETG